MCSRGTLDQEIEFAASLDSPLKGISCYFAIYRISGASASLNYLNTESLLLSTEFNENGKNMLCQLYVIWVG